MLLTGALLAATANTTILKKIVSTLSFEMERRLKPKHDEVKLFAQHFMGIIQFVSYNQPHLQGYKDGST